MVFESIVVSILNKYIGKYVKNLDSKNLSIGLWSGEATLCDLELREEALLEYDLPVEVNSGYIGKLSLNIPWSSIYVNPVVVRIEDVYVLTGPQAEKPYNEEKERKYLNIIKQKQLHTIVKGEKRSREQVVSSVKDTNDTLTEKLTAQIIKNVQVFITSIHLRYEDKITNPSHPFTFGVTLHSISAQTTDANWLPAVIDGSTKNNFKLLRMESLSFYWNPKDMSLLNGLPNWKSLMRSQISQWASIELSQEFILRPLSLTIKAIVDQDAKVLMKFPKFVLNIILKDLSLELSKLQFEGIINLVESFEMMSINQQYRKYKPSEGVKENPMKWWKYAYTSIVETSYRPWTWARIKEHRVEYKKYVALYRQMLKFEYLDEKKSLNVIRSKIKKEEDELNAANILIARKQAQNEFDNAKKAGIEATPEKETVGWLEWLGITGNLTENQEEELDMSAGETFSLAALSAEQKDELYRAIGYVNDTTHPVYLKTYIRSKLSLHLDNCSVTLKDTQTRKIATFSMIKLVSELSERPGSEGYGFKLEVENMGVFSEVGVQDVDILKTKTIAENFLALNFQINPTERTADYSVDLVIQPMHVMYNKQFADAIRHFFVIQNKELEQNASSKLDEISYASRAGIEYSIMSNKSTYLHVNLKSPVVILPHQGICDRTNEELYLYLGDLTVATDLRTLLTEQAISEATESDLEQMFYHKTDVKLSDIHVGCGFFDNEKKQIEDSCCDNYILPPSQVEVTVYRSLKSGYANFPDFKISGILPSFEVKLTEKKVIQIVEVVNYFLPAATPSSTHNKSHSQSSQSKRKLSGSVMSKSDLSNLQDILNQSTKPRKRKLNVFSNETTSLDVEIDVPDSLQSYDSNLSMYDRTKLLASFEIMKISICYAVMIDSKVTKFLNLVIKNISSNIEMHMWDIKIKAKLQFFTLTDYINKDLNNDPVEIIVSTDHTDLIHVEWKQADVSGPEFTTTFQQTENFVNIKFGVLKFHLREQALMLFLNSFQSLSHRVSMILDQTVPVPTTSQLLDVIAEDDKVDIESKESLHKLEEAVMVSTSLHINFVLSTINFSIADISQDVAYGDISDIKLSIIVRSCAVEIFAQLKSFEVFDATLDVMCKKIVSVNADKVLKCNITQYHDISKDNLDPDMTIDLNLGKLRLNIVQRFIVNLLRMFQSISSSLITQESTAAHIPVVQDRDTAGEIFKLKLDVVIDAPDIALPVSKCDDQYFLLDLGHCEIHSELIEKNNKISDKITFSLQELKLLRIDMDKQRQNISPISLEIVLIRSLNDIIPMFEIDCKLPVLAMKLHKQDIMSFMTCLHGIIEDIGGLLQDTSSDVKEVIKSPKCTEQQQPTQIINAVVNIHQVALQAFSEEAKEEILFLNLTAETVTLTYQQQTTILAVEVSLGFLSLIDLKTKDAFDNPVTLFTSIDGQELASMSYSSDTSSNCQSISVELNQVTINANDESVTSLVDYLKDFSESVNAVFDKDEKQSEEMSVVSEHEQALSKFDVHCKLNTLSFYWHTKKNIFAKSQVDGLTLLLDKTGNNVGVKTRLKNLYMEDLRNNALYSKIIVLEDQDLLSLEFSLKEHTSLSIGNDMCGAQVAYVWLRVGKIKVVLLYKFIMEIMNCVNPFLLSLSGNNDGKSLHDDKHELTSPNEESKMLLFHLDIDVTAPVILIPKLSTSTTHLVLDLGKCIVTNSVETDGSPEGAETENEITIDHVKASLSSVKLIIMNLRDEKEKRVSKDISASVHIYRPLNPSANKITVNIDVLPVIVLLSDVDIQLLMNIVQLNLGEADNSVTANGNVIGKTSIIEADVHRDCGDVSSGTTRKEHNGATLATEIDDCESEFVTENEETPAIKIEIHCELIELHLSSVLLFQDCSEEQNINICRLSASSASVKIFKTDDLIDLHLTIFQLTGDDQRPFSIATFKRILEKQTNHNECSVPDMSVISASTFFKQHGRNDNHITVTYTAKNDKQAVALIIADARTFVNLEFINDLISYLSNIFTGDFINYIDHTTSDESTVKQNITPISEERASAKLSVTCQLENGEVILLENPNKNSTTAIVSRIQLNLKYVADQSATIIKIPMCVVEILFGEYPVLRRTARPLLQPCQLECEINMPDSATKDISINVQVMKFKLSPSILTTIIKITENLTSSQLLQEEEITSCKQTSYVDWTSHPLSDDKINRKDSIHTNSVVVETKIAGKEKAKLSFAMIEVILGNDLEGMFNPLLTAKISTRANILDWSALMRIDADFTTEVFYFNELVGTWEPFIEPSINAASCQPYEVNARMFYGESKQMDFSSNDLCKEDDDGLFADEIDATGDEKKGDALIVIISSEDVLQLTVTQKAIEMLTYVTQVLSLKSLGDNVKTKLLLPFHFESQLGLPVVICMEPSVKASTTNDSHLEFQPRLPLVDAQQVTQKVSFSDQPGKSLKRRKERNYSLSSGKAIPSIDVSDSNPWLVGELSQTDCIDIEVHGYLPVKNISLKEAGNQIYALLPHKDGNLFQLVVQVKIVTGSRIVILGSSIQIVNNLKLPIEIFTENTIGSAVSILEVNGGTKTCLSLQHSLLTEFMVKNKRFSFDEPIGLKGDDQVIKGCTVDQSNRCYIKVRKIATDQKYQKSVPIHTIEFLPVVQITSYLPVNVQMQLKNDKEQSQYHSVNSGETLDVLDMNLKDDFTVSMRYINEKGNEWIGTGKCGKHKKESTAVFLKNNATADIRFEIGLEKRSHSIQLLIYSVFWVVNKTGLDLNFKVDSREYILNSSKEHEPRLISYANVKKTKGRLCVGDSTWSEAFSLSAVGDESFVTCKSDDGSYAVYISIQLSHTGLTNIISLSARYLISNHTSLDLMFAEVLHQSIDVEELSWIPLPIMQCSPVWLHSPTASILLKEKDSAFVGAPIPFNCDNKLAKRLSNSQTVCVDVNHLGDEFIMNVTSYEEGCIPLRVDNYCNSSIFLQQRDVESLAAVTEYLPKSTQYFNWLEFDKAHQIVVMLLHPNSRKRNVNISLTGWGRMIMPENSDVDGVDKGEKKSCFGCPSSCFPSLCKKAHNEEDAQHLLSPISASSPSSELVYWVSYLEGMQRVLAFTMDFSVARILRYSGDLEDVTTEVFLSLQGVGMSLINSVPKEICYAAFTGGTSVWEVETKENIWKTLDIDTSTYLEDSWKNSVFNARFENKIAVDLKAMMMTKPYRGKIKRSCDPAVWVQYSQSKNNASFYLTMHRLQVDSQQYDVIYPSVLYPAPLPPRVLKRNGLKPLLEFFIVFSSSHDVMIIKYLKVLLQEVNLKIDRSIVNGIMSLVYNANTESSGLATFEHDIEDVKESVEKSFRAILESKSSKLLINYFHLSPVKIHLSFSMDDETSTSSTSNEELLQWFISTIGIQFTDISDAVIKLGYFERKNTSITKDLLLADATKHYALQAVKQFHVLVLGLDVLGNPYGLISEYRQGVKDLFYEPYLGSVAGPHQFAKGLAYGIKSLLGHTIGGTAGAASLITEQLGQVVAAMSFDSEYKRRRRREMSADPSGVGQGLAIGGKQFILGLMFGISGLVTQPVKGARKGGIEGFFKGVGKGILGLLVKPTGGVIDLVTSSLDGVRRFAEQGGEDIVVRARLPRVTYPGKPVTVYNSEKSYGCGLLRSLRAKQNIEGEYMDHLAIPNDEPTIVIFTSDMVIEATQSRFFSEWKVEWSTYYKLIKNIEMVEETVRFIVKFSSVAKESVSISHATYHEVLCSKMAVAKMLQEKALTCWKASEKR